MVCYHDSRDPVYRAPSGAVPCATEVTLRLRVTEKVPDSVLLRIWNGKETFYPMHPSEEDATLYEVCVTMPQTPCLVWYDFHIWEGGQFSWYGNAEDRLGGIGAPIWGEARSYQITVYDAAFHVPEWTHGAVFYQIFPDRFRTDRAAHKRAGDRLLVAWDEPVAFHADAQTGDHYPVDFYGGSLRGIREKLPYLQELGVTALYLNPCFAATSNHRYDTIDWKKIDPLLGDEEDFRALCQAAEQVGIRVILDGVFSHAGALHPFFLQARNDRNSEHAKWFIFKSWPDDYKCWWGFRNLPELDKNNPDVRKYFISDDDAVSRRWLRQGAAGWRLDVADELPMDYLRQLRTAVRAEDENAYLLGEVWEDASNKVSYGEMRCYCLGDTLDGVMNYPLRKAALAFLMGKISASRFKRHMDCLYENYPAPFASALLNVMGSHDRVRTLNVLAGVDGEDLPRSQRGKVRLSARQRELGKQRLKLMLQLICMMPGMPCVYYGDEAGMEGTGDPFNRAPFPWGKEDKELQAFFRQTLGQYHACPVLVDGALAMEAPHDDVLFVQRKAQSGCALLAVNRGNRPHKASAFGHTVTLKARSCAFWQA